MTFGTTAVKTSRETIDATSGGGRIGKADDVVENAGQKLIYDIDEFAITGDSRSEVYISTVSQFSRGGTAVGSLLAQGIMFIPHLILGTGGEHESDASLYKKFRDNGVVGCVAKGATSVVSGAVGLGGHVVGALAGTVFSDVTRLGADMSMLNSAMTGAEGGGKMAAQSTGIVVGSAVGLPIGAARLGITGTEYAVSTVGALAGGVVGLAAGAVVAVVKG